MILALYPHMFRITTFYLKVLRRLGILPRLNFALGMNKASKRYIIPVVGGVGVEHFLGDTELWMDRLLRLLLPLGSESGIFVDVGVNIGQTLLKVRCLSERWDYIGFEPNPSCLSYVHKLTKVNQLSSVRIFPCALAERYDMGTLHLFTDSSVDASASVVPNFRPNVAASFPVFVIDADRLAAFSTDSVAVIKIDVEGAELGVLKGFEKIIKRDSPFIICEILPVYSAEGGPRLRRQTEMERLLHRLGYMKFLVTKDGGLLLRQEIGIHSDPKNCNYLFVPAAVYEDVKNHFKVLEA